MFNSLYKQYKIEILKTDSMSLKDLKPYEKLFLTFFILGSILIGIFSLLDIKVGIYISFGFFFVCLIIFMFFSGKKTEQKRRFDEIIKPKANTRMKKMVSLLKEYGVDISEEKQLEQLIIYAKMEQDVYDVWKGLRKATKGMATYIILPIITIFLSEFFSDVELEMFLIRAGILLFIGFIIVLLVCSFSIDINDMLNPDIRDLEYFIRDIEDVKAFPAKAQEMIRT
jgi:hypothetical protein